MRKAEEALIVWLIENNQLVSKERMLEVYFNIIEWGSMFMALGRHPSFTLMWSQRPIAKSVALPC